MRPETIPIIALSCNHCGAPLEAPESMRFLTCSHCGSRLEMKRSESAIYTTVLERIEKNTENISDDLKIIQLQNELERLDREWQMEREKYVRRDKDGREVHPAAMGTVVGWVIMIAVGIFIAIAGPMKKDPWLLIVGAGISITGIWNFRCCLADGELLQSHYDRYSEKRGELTARIAELRKS